MVVQCRTAGRDDVVCVVLGRGADDEKVDHWLREAAPVEGYVGFAIGRSIWGNPLKGWIDEDRVFLSWRERLRGLLAAWEATAKAPESRDREALLGGRLLAEASEWQDLRAEDLAPAERAFIGTSRTAWENEQAAERDRQARELEHCFLTGAIVLLCCFGCGADGSRRCGARCCRAKCGRVDAE